ncbi:MAG: alpha/beta hydrolase [Candidatus Kariarchaeaceae archaeon]|jgi:enterochelin esterase-like enzyme
MKFNYINTKTIGIGVMLIIIVSSVIFYMIPDSDDGWTKEEFVIHSYHLGDDFNITVGLPPNYNEKSVSKYHAIYLLDAMYYYDDTGPFSRVQNGGVISIMERLSAEDKIPNTILVGIGYIPDFAHQGRYIHSAVYFFRRFFQEELIPYIDENYNVIPYPEGRTLMGHSGTAHVTVYTMMSGALLDEQLFKRFIAVSGSYDSSRNAYKQEEELFEDVGLSGLAGRILYMIVGTDDDIELPWLAGSPWLDPSLLNSHRSFVQKLQNRKYVDFTFESEEYEGYGHWDIQEFGFESGLGWVFQQV